MLPNVAGTGHSFEGAALYYLHDKRLEGEAERLTTERVWFTHTENMLTDDPEKAWKVMAWTAMHQNEIKKAAGVKATGRKMKGGPVYAYSLSWHPEQEPSREQMIEAGQATLKVLGFEGHEVLMAAHNDEPQPHLHVIVNRIHPMTGKAQNPVDDYTKLSRWAQAHEEQFGTIYCQQRVVNNARRANGEFVRGTTGKKKADYHAERKAEKEAREGANENRREDERPANDNRQQQLAEQHAAQIAALLKMKAFRLQTRKDQLRETYRAKWRELYRQQQAENDAGNRERKSVLERLKEWFKAPKGEKKPLAVVFGLTDRKARAIRGAETEQLHRQERVKLGSEYRSQVKTATREIEQAHNLTLEQMRKQHAAERQLTPEQREALAIAEAFNRRKQASQNKARDKEHGGPELEI